jgi:hypothetical protein
MNGPCYVKCRHRRPNILWFHLYKGLEYAIYGEKSRIKVPRGWGRGQGTVIALGIVYVKDHEKGFGGWVYSLWMYLMSL